MPQQELRCECCKQPMIADRPGVQLVISDDPQHYHAHSGIDGALSCWEKMIISWATVIHSPVKDSSIDMHHRLQVLGRRHLAIVTPRVR